MWIFGNIINITTNNNFTKLITIYLFIFFNIDFFKEIMYLLKVLKKVIKLKQKLFKFYFIVRMPAG